MQNFLCSAVWVINPLMLLVVYVFTDKQMTFVQKCQLLASRMLIMLNNNVKYYGYQSGCMARHLALSNRLLNRTVFQTFSIEISVSI